MPMSSTGTALAPYRDSVIIATKFGVKHEAWQLVLDPRPETIRKAIEGSLKKLSTDHVDLYYQHRIDPNVEPEGASPSSMISSSDSSDSSVSSSMVSLCV